MSGLAVADSDATRQSAIEKRLTTLAGLCDTLSTPDMIRRLADQEFPGRVAVASSFGVESVALLAIVAEAAPTIPVLFLDTGVLFDETLEYSKTVAKALGLKDVRYVRPDKRQLESEDPETSLWAENPDRCCSLRKVEPFREALAPFDCWISGLKRAHGGVRSSVQQLEIEDGRIKFNPIADWPWERVQDFIRTRGLPEHPLLKRGYTSVGCVPCTRLGRQGEGLREGRWSRVAKNECGIHPRLYRMSSESSKASVDDMHASLLNRSWLITGVCGTLGRKLLDRVLQLQPRRVVGFDNNESELYFLYDRHRKNPNIKFYTGDVRDRNEVESRMEGCEYVFHTAAAKHVYLCEEAPTAAINANIIGTQNVIDAALAVGVERLLFTSSDKAVNPTNVMGASKLMAERLVSAANAKTRRARQVFSSTRFGNVLGSRGSVIPIFLRQIRAGGPVTLTHPEMTRFIMTMREAVQLVMDTVFLARGGEIFVTKMPVVRISDLAEVMIEELAGSFGYKPRDVAIEMIGNRPGEKMYEELMNEEERSRALELPEYFVIRPSVLSNFRDIDYTYPNMTEVKSAVGGYNSKVASAMEKEELRAYLRANPELLHGDE